MTSATISPGAAASREAARQSDGQFGVQLHAEGDNLEVENPFTKRYDSVDEKIAALRGELDKGIESLADDEQWHHFLDTMSKFHSYSMSNQLLIAMQCPDATRVAGFKAWKANFERSVKKGEKAIAILAPRVVTMTDKDENGKPRLKDGKPVKVRRVIGFTTASVFDVSQTEGKALPEAREQLSEEPPEGLREDLEAAIRDAGFEVSYREIPGAAHGYTAPGQVVIDPRASAANQTKTLAHELGHIKAGHLERTDEYHTGAHGCRGEMEAVAESIAYVVCRHQGMSTEMSRNSSRYIEGWTSGDRETVQRTAEEVQKVVKDILGSGHLRSAS